MIALQIAVDVLMDLTMVHSRAPGDPRASHWAYYVTCSISLTVSLNMLPDPPASGGYLRPLWPAGGYLMPIESHLYPLRPARHARLADGIPFRQSSSRVGRPNDVSGKSPSYPRNVPLRNQHDKWEMPKVSIYLP